MIKLVLFFWENILSFWPMKSGSNFFIATLTLNYWTILGFCQFYSVKLRLAFAFSRKRIIFPVSNFQILKYFSWIQKVARELYLFQIKFYIKLLKIPEMKNSIWINLIALIFIQNLNLFVLDVISNSFDSMINIFKKKFFKF